MKYLEFTLPPPGKADKRLPLRQFARNLLVSLLPAALVFIAGYAHAAKIIVTIEGVRNDKGDVYVALFDKPDKFPDGDYSMRHTKRKARPGAITIVFDNLPPNTYAVGAYHDENGNHRLDTNFIGYPIEGYALSNGIRAIISRPRFVDAAFIVGEENKQVSLHIRY